MQLEGTNTPHILEVNSQQQQQPAAFPNGHKNKKKMGEMEEEEEEEWAKEPLVPWKWLFELGGNGGLLVGLDWIGPRNGQAEWTQTNLIAAPPVVKVTPPPPHPLLIGSNS
jgi:hypothetical protein